MFSLRWITSNGARMTVQFKIPVKQFPSKLSSSSFFLFTDKIDFYFNQIVLVNCSRKEDKASNCGWFSSNELRTWLRIYFWLIFVFFNSTMQIQTQTPTKTDFLNKNRHCDLYVINVMFKLKQIVFTS